MPAGVIRALVPTAIAAVLLSQEFPLANLDTDGTLFTVVIYGVSYSDAIARISGWMSRSHIGPVLVTDARRPSGSCPFRQRPGHGLRAACFHPRLRDVCAGVSEAPAHAPAGRSAHGVTANTPVMPRSTWNGTSHTVGY